MGLIANVLGNRYWTIITYELHSVGEMSIALCNKYWIIKWLYLYKFSHILNWQKKDTYTSGIQHTDVNLWIQHVHAIVWIRTQDVCVLNDGSPRGYDVWRKRHNYVKEINYSDFACQNIASLWLIYQFLDQQSLNRYIWFCVLMIFFKQTAHKTMQ